MDSRQSVAYAGSTMNRRPATIEEARALSNPLRLRILRLCLDRAMTNKELAERLGRDPGTILHHVRVLHETGFLAPEAERRGARGSTERPYRATGKSWTLDVGDDTTGSVAMVDAFREELRELGRKDVRTLARLGVRLRPEAAASIVARLQEIIDELAASDDPEGEPYGFLVAAHRRRDDRPVRSAAPRRARARTRTPS
jgi:predicted ArsR family transcriptional regulator